MKTKISEELRKEMSELYAIIYNSEFAIKKTEQRLREIYKNLNDGNKQKRTTKISGDS